MVKLYALLLLVFSSVLRSSFQYPFTLVDVDIGRAVELVSQGTHFDLELTHDDETKAGVHSVEIPAWFADEELVFSFTEIIL